jgi:multiple antibiotic resistance protein
MPRCVNLDPPTRGSLAVFQGDRSVEFATSRSQPTPDVGTYSALDGRDPVEELWIGHAASIFMGFFAIMNPIANTPVFLGLTADADAATRRGIATRALIFSFLVVLFFCAAGKIIFGVFGITLPAFRITGGALVALVGFHMLQGGQHSTVHQPNPADLQKCRLEAELEIAFTPLAMPILAGPGTIATAMNYASAGTVADFALTVSAFGVLCAITYAFFLSGEQIVRFLGENGVKHSEHSGP